MNMIEHAAARVASARDLGRPPIKWIATPALAEEYGLADELHGVPLERNVTRFGLELVCARPK